LKFKDIFLENRKIETIMRRKFPEVRLVMSETNKYVILKVLLIQKERRNKGEARAFMKDLIEICDKNNLDIYLTPSDVYDGDIKRLNKFYKSLGFVKNTTNVTNEALVRFHRSHL